MRAVRLASWLAAGLAPAGLAVAGVLVALAGEQGESWWLVVVWIVATLPSTAIGLLLARRGGNNPIGWLLLANGLVLTAFGLADSWIDYAVLADPGALPGRPWAVLFSERAWPLLFAPLTAIAWIFPDGRLPSPRWRPFALAGAASYALLLALSLLAANRFSDRVAHVESPLPQLSESVIGVPFALAGLGAIGCLAGGALAVHTRFRRATGTERQQLKWLAYAATLVPATVAVCLLEIAVVGHEDVGTSVVLLVAMVAVPAAIGIAVMRYRLYEIDRLINRTLVYAGLSAGLGAVFVTVSLSLGVAIGSGSTLPTAAATLAVAVLFGPLRRRMQLLVDRRFDRARYEGLRAVERYHERLRAGAAAPEATEEMLADALGDPTLQLLFWLPETPMQVDARGRVVEPAGERSMTPVRRGDLALATVVHDPALDEKPDLVESVIGAAGLAIEIARLRVEVRHQLAEVEASRRRIVTAGYAERRRLERDLHDGAQQRLVSIGLALRHVQAELPPTSSQVEALDATVAELARAIEELRELARGVRPAGLDDGLAPALRALASRSPLRTRVEATDERFEDRVETAAYFVASEALTNAAKHARASRVAVSAARRNGSLVVRVSDDGIGGATPSLGSGLAGISDRVAALGGRVTVASPAGDGTVVIAELPCGS